MTVASSVLVSAARRGDRERVKQRTHTWEREDELRREAASRQAHLSRLESIWSSCGLRSLRFSYSSPTAFIALISLSLLPPTRARVRSTPSSIPSPFTPRMSSCAYVLRTWNESGSSPADGVIDRSLRFLPSKRDEVDVAVVCECGRLRRRDEGLVKEACSERGTLDDRGMAAVCPFKGEELCDRVEEGRLCGGLGLRYRVCGDVGPTRWGWEAPLPLCLWGCLGGVGGGNMLRRLSSSSPSVPM